MKGTWIQKMNNISGEDANQVRPPTVSYRNLLSFLNINERRIRVWLKNNYGIAKLVGNVDKDHLEPMCPISLRFERILGAILILVSPSTLGR